MGGHAIMFRCAVAVALLPGFACGGDPVQTNFSGYLVDIYCYGLCRANTDPQCALDHTNVITKPSDHQVHCLRDPPPCYVDFFLAVNNGDSVNGDYHIKLRLDDVGNQRALDYTLQQYPVDHPLSHAKGNYTLMAMGWHNGDGYLRNATFVQCDHHECDSKCSGNCVTPAWNRFINPPKLIWAHVIFMLLSWGCMLPLGVVWARNLRSSPAKLGGAPIWFGGHRLIQSIGWAFQILGFVCIYLQKRQSGKLARHFSIHHEIIGLVVVVIGTLQPFNAQLRHLSCVGHPGQPGPFRKVWEWLHKGLGYIAAALGMLNVCLGVWYASKIGFAGGLIPFAASFAVISIGAIVVAGVTGELRGGFGSKSPVAASRAGDTEIPLTESYR